MEQNPQSSENSVEIKSDGEGEPMIYNSKKHSGRKIIILVLAVIILAIAGYIYFSFFNKKDYTQLPKENAETAKEKEVKIDKNLDSDQDKLPDYLEKIIGTDENNPDTDGDTYSDFEEIKNGYNALTADKYSIEEWEAVKGKIKVADGGFYEKAFGGSISNSNKEAESFVCGSTTVSDIDNNTYNTVKIGEQCWLKENLKVTKNPAGEAITRYCYDNDPKICETDGGLYDWNTAMNNSTTEGAQGICPNGWHVPKDSEWYVLESGLAEGSCSKIRTGSDCSPAGAKLVRVDSDFKNIFAGHRETFGKFYDRGSYATLWSSTENGLSAWYRYLNSGSSVIRHSSDKVYGYSVRCLKD